MNTFTLHYNILLLTIIESHYNFPTFHKQLNFLLYFSPLVINISVESVKELGNK